MGGWRPTGTMLQRREGAGAAALAGYLLVCGGLDGRRWVVQSAERFNPAVNRWEMVGSMETRRAFVASAPAPIVDPQLPSVTRRLPNRSSQTPLAVQQSPV